MKVKLKEISSSNRPQISLYHLAPGRLEVPVSIGTPTNATSSPSAVSWKGSRPMVGIPDTRATNSALVGTLKHFPEDLLTRLRP